MPSVKKNYLYSVAFQLLTICMPLITSPYISRVLGAEMLGTQTYCYSIANYFYIFAMLGVANYGNRSIARVRDNKRELTKTFWTIYDFQLMRAGVMTLLYFLFVFIFFQQYRIIAFINGIYVFSSAIEISWFFFGLEEFKITVIRNAVLKILNTICIFIFVKSQSDLWIYSLLVCGSAVLTNASLWVFAKRYIGFYKPKLFELLPHIKPEIVLFIPVISISIYNVMDKVMLGYMCTTTDVGYYNNAESIITIPLGFITALGNVMMPHAANLIARKKEEQCKAEIEKSILFVMLVSCPMAFGVAGISNVFAPVYFGKNFLPCATLMAWLAPKIVFCSWANVIRTQYLIPRNKDREYIISILAGAGINLLMNLCLIPHLAALGAVIGTICAEFTVAFMQTFFVRKQLPVRQYLFESIPFIAFGFFMFVCVRKIVEYFGVNVLSLLIGIISGILIYITLVILFLLFSQKAGINHIRSL